MSELVPMERYAVVGVTEDARIDRARIRRWFPALMVRRPCWTLTCTGRLVVFTLVLVFALICGRNLCAFLSATSSVHGQLIVVEGWVPTYACRAAVAEYAKGNCRKIIAAGTVQSNDASPEFVENSQIFAKHKLIQLGVPSDLVITVACKGVERDRTFQSALAVRTWVTEQSFPIESIDIVTVGAHARRSRFLYQKAFGKEFRVGVIAVENRDFDAKHWWRSSEGVRQVVSEGLAYLYARVFF